MASGIITHVVLDIASHFGPEIGTFDSHDGFLCSVVSSGCHDVPVGFQFLRERVSLVVHFLSRGQTCADRGLLATLSIRG